MASLQQSKRSGKKWCTMEVRWGIFIENLTVFLLLTSDREYSFTNSYNFRHDCYFARWSSHSWSLGCLWSTPNIIDPSPRKWLVTILRPRYTRHVKDCPNSKWRAGQDINFRYNWRKGEGNQMHQTISFSKTKLNARFRSVATKLRKKQNKNSSFKQYRIYL